MDHFLGKEAVQNLFALRFANGIFEPVWNRNYVDHVQITAAETLGVEGRGSYYETAGAVRDMVQNHLLQLCALVAIEAPAQWNPDTVRDEKVKVLRAVKKIEPAEVGGHAVRGQYGNGAIAGQPVAGYGKENDVAADSNVETYAALKLFIDNWRWAGVPFYLRSGKRLAKSSTQIVIEFKTPPHTPWNASREASPPAANLLVVDISQEGLFIRLEGKVPGQEMRLRSIYLDYCLWEESAREAPSAYERLLLDSMRGDPTFFARADEVEAAWEIVEPVIKTWEAEKAKSFPNYAVGSGGPVEADELLAADGRRWHNPAIEA
jgi:glucose-6-phosphate 1-dehydrogenase